MEKIMKRCKHLAHLASAALLGLCVEGASFCLLGPPWVVSASLNLTRKSVMNRGIYMSTVTYFFVVICYTGCPPPKKKKKKKKKWNGILPTICGIVDAISGISVWGNFSWEEWHQDQISNFGSVVCILGHILWDHVEAPNFPFSAQLP